MDTTIFDQAAEILIEKQVYQCSAEQIAAKVADYLEELLLTEPYWLIKQLPKLHYELKQAES